MRAEDAALGSVTLRRCWSEGWPGERGLGDSVIMGPCCGKTWAEDPL